MIDDLLAISASLGAAFAQAQKVTEPYDHWLLSKLFPTHILQQLQTMAAPAPGPQLLSGTRESNNETRYYLNAESNRKHRFCAAVSAAFQTMTVVTGIEQMTGAHLEGSYLRIEYAQDSDGFWLVPHTDIGAKLFTLLIYLSGEDEQLGTDIYSARDAWAGRTPFAPNLGLAFVPSDKTWHGFEKRPIRGIRKTLIVNYVKPEWRARDQLAFPDQPVTSR
ncbi:2OG-Fe(II) oxygenase [Martelella endophytica]|uniref:Prolyl 4-hydroxylase alpha subunit Fe(2+) 2OG dioxygenase domain-containing protein n=1 Tax=Martelella endophytica TaxID=1486262 RepID=A0A0D5LSB0_MAREN|nr:2OG-Fe(II) oxygenase [Martelella endophytica]AJY46961.1 hypothetical protein TM49_16750 [Martelella endophytica]